MVEGQGQGQEEDEDEDGGSLNQFYLEMALPNTNVATHRPTPLSHR